MSSSKVPQVTLVFWIIKIAATTLGETGGHAVSMSMNLGYLLATAIFAVIRFGLCRERSPVHGIIGDRRGRLFLDAHFPDCAVLDCIRPYPAPGRRGGRFLR